MNKLLTFIILVPLVLGISGCTTEKLIGGQRDEHGCLTPAGYTWCEAKQKCLRTWEEKCQPEGQIIVKQSGGAGMLIIQCADKNYITETADYIIEGTVEKVEVKEVNEGGIFTYSDILIEKYLKGTPFDSDKLQIKTPGGCIEEICLWVEDQPIFHEGTKVRIYFQKMNGEFSIVCGLSGVIIIEEPPLPTGNCTEDDDGFDIYKKAVTKGLGGGKTGLFYKGTFLKEGYHEVEDYCYIGHPSNSSFEGDHLKEYICSNGRISFGDWECTCKNGACRK